MARDDRRHASVTNRPSGGTAFLVTSYPGQPGVVELAEQAAAGKRPRRAYVEVARILEVEVIDSHYIDHRASWLARAVARRLGMPAGQLCEAFLRRHTYKTICAWADRLGVPLALLDKVTPARRNLVLVSDWLSRPKKAFLVRYLRAHTNVQAIINSSSVQRELAATRLGVPRSKLHFVPYPVDDRFWQPRPEPTDDFILAVGMEARDYSTFLKSVRDMDVQVHVAVGTIVFAPGTAGADSSTSVDASPFQFLRRTFGYRFYSDWTEELARTGLPPNVRLSEQLTPLELRELYARARFVVVPLHDVDSDCGISTIVEAMAMGKALVVTRTRGQIDAVEDGKHGMYVPPSDPDALRSAIDHLLQHPELAEAMGRAGRARIEERHSMDAYVERLTGIFTGRGRPGDRRQDGEASP